MNTQFRLCQDLWTDKVLRDRMLLVVQYVPECAMTVYKPASTFYGVCEDICNAVGIILAETLLTDVFLTGEDDNGSTYVDDPTILGNSETMMTERRFIGNYTQQDAQRNCDVFKASGQLYNWTILAEMICNVCHKRGCISYNYPVSEQNVVLQDVQKACGQDARKTQQFLSELEGSIEQSLLDDHIDHVPSTLSERDGSNHWTIIQDNFVIDHFSAICNSDAQDIIDALNEQSLVYAMTRALLADATDVAFLTSHYSLDVFMSILIDTGVAYRSTAREAQFQALQ